MNKRLNLVQQASGGVSALIAMDKYLSGTSLSKTHWELIKIRASQINGCSFCINKHSKEARRNGETEQRINLLTAWRETDFYSEEEEAILALTEEMTLISEHGVREDTYQQALQLFGEQPLANIMMAIISINTWNRIGVSTHMRPEADQQ